LIKILFICSCLEPGKDGVGDYTRKLAGALINRGHEAVIAAINDRLLQDETIWKGQQYDDNTYVEVLRLPSSLPWRLRLDEARKFADEFNPGWISFQYVPFGFQVKGLPFNIGRKLKSIGTNQCWHIMFHELSVDKTESLKFRVWALMQAHIIKTLVKTVKSALITTNTEVYRGRLEEMGFAAKRLPLFSNISHVRDNRVEIPGNIVPSYLLNNRKDYVIGTLFGNFAVKSWGLASLLDKLSTGSQNKKVIIAALGRMPSGKEYWKILPDQYPHIIFLALGVQDVAFISYWLSEYTDFGILTTPPELAGKSGSFMAFKEHGIPVVCKERGQGPEKYSFTLEQGLTEIKESEDFQIP
jgi:hypothetical protein